MSNLNSTAPTENSQGYQVWKPSTGIVFDDGRNHADSYAGIIAALRDGIVKAGNIPKAYPHNFAGIIAAIQDLEAAEAQKPPVLPSPIPPGSEIDSGTGDLNIIIKPEDGLLWFDTRQGRLFVAIDEEWWQTNGADGLAYVEPTPPSTSLVVTGQFWYDPVNGDLYVFNGTDWVLTSGDGAFQTTGSLPLDARLDSSNPNPNPFGWEPGTDTPGYDPTLDPINIQDPFFRLMDTQRDYNGWILDSLWDLDQALGSKSASVEIGNTPPLTPKVGDLWFDVNAVEMSIYYDDGNTEQWVPVSVAWDYNEFITYIDTVITEVSDREFRNVSQLSADIATLQYQLEQADQSIRDEITEAVSNIVFPETDLTSYSTTVDTEGVRAELTTKVNETRYALEAAINTAKNELEQSDLTLTTDLQTKASLVDLQATLALIPDISHLESSTGVDEKIAAITNNFLPRGGGVLNGRFVMQKADIGFAALDFSTEHHYSRNALVLKAMMNKDSTVSFGTTETDGEVAFNFSDKEEFTWQHSVEDKVFSIDRNGAAAETIYLGDFGDNDINGRVIHNRIDVRERLVTYQTSIEQLRQAVANASDFEELKSGLTTALQTV